LGKRKNALGIVIRPWKKEIILPCSWQPCF